MYDLIFEGTARVVLRAVGGGQRAVFEVHRVWRGEVGRRATVHVGEDTCHNRFERGERRVVFAQRSRAGHLFVDTCSHTWWSAELAALGEGMPRSEARCDAGDRRDAWVIVVPLLLARRRGRASGPWSGRRRVTAR